MRPETWERLALAAAAVVLVLSSVFLAVVGPDRAGTSDAIAPSSPGVSAPVPSGTPAPAPVATVAPAPTRAPSVTAAPAHASGPGTAKPPIAGKYVYTVTGSDGTRTANVVISDTAPGRQSENDDDSGTIDEVAWGSSGKFELATTFTFPQGSFRCDWSPDFPDYVFPLKDGASWTERGSCHPSATSSISVDGTAHVRGPERLTVGGQSVEAWVVVLDGTLRFDANGSSFSEKIHDEDHFSPEHGITVKDVLTGVDTDPSGKQTQDSETRNLQNLSPGTSA